MEPSYSEEERQKMGEGVNDDFMRDQRTRESTNQQLPGDDKSFRSTFKLYRILYLLAGASIY